MLTTVRSVRLGRFEKVRAWWLLIGACTFLLAGCQGDSRRAVPPPTTAATTIGGTADAAGTVWLCQPGAAGDPCAVGFQTTVVPATGTRTVETPPAATDPAFDCFYVYPTVSTETTDNADLAVQAAEIDTAVAQASPFSQVCRVWAPMYRQATLASLLDGSAVRGPVDQIAYRSLRSGWEDYLAHYNEGRPVIFIGHSQGAAMLIRLLSSEVDPDPALRQRVVSAIVAGGNLTVPSGQLVGATFRHLPLCSRPIETGCVIAYSTFPSQPPPDALFGRPGLGVSLLSGQSVTTGVQVACVNPGALAGGTAALTPYFLKATSSPPPPPVGTLWVTYPDLYTARCHTGGGASWLQVSTVAASGDHRPVVMESLGPTWGYHVDDINLALGNLVQDVRRQEAAYRA
jgi:hypothetical protein